MSLSDLGICMINRPSTSVATACVVPLTFTTTPGNGSSLLSSTVPITVTRWVLGCSFLSEVCLFSFLGGV